MLPRWLNALLVVLQEAWSARRDARIRFIKLQPERSVDAAAGPECKHVGSGGRDRLAVPDP